MKIKILLILIFLIALTNQAYPVAIFHGMGDSCDSEGM